MNHLQDASYSSVNGRLLSLSQRNNSAVHKILSTKDKLGIVHAQKCEGEKQ